MDEEVEQELVLICSVVMGGVTGLGKLGHVAIPSSVVSFPFASFFLTCCFLLFLLVIEEQL